ncbi:hypothetical protein [Paenibacillus polymyxa]|uniref:hypothetical protein n=1 Tax=Paenibacillus polymyxa TaxID=1406 RepID=UPI00287FE45E|nr:hypothetical protein [Paenibacillus polymyxa]
MKGNYLEASASCMFLYAIARAFAKAICQSNIIKRQKSSVRELSMNLSRLLKKDS